MSENVPDEYDEWTVSEVAAAVANVDDLTVVRDWYTYEAAHKDRTTALAAIDERTGELEDDGDEPTVDEEDAGDEEEPAEDSPEGFVKVRNLDGKGKHAGGHSFGPGELKIVRSSPQLEEAIRRGELQYVG